MLKVEDAIRAISTPKGKLYFHLCSDCGKEIGPNSSWALRTRTGYCNRCFKINHQWPCGQRLLHLIQVNAIKCNTDSSITEEQAAFLSQLATCHYCGSEVVWGARTNLDRKDPAKGYHWDNVVVCCFPCNRVKSNVLSYDEMRIAMEAVRIFRKLDDAGRKELQLALIEFTMEWAL